MKFTIKEETESPTIRLWLEEWSDRIVLVGEDGSGRKKTLLGFKDGKFYRYVSSELEGLETDSNGRIVEG